MNEVVLEKVDRVSKSSEMSGILLRGGTKTVDREPTLDELEVVSMERIVRMEPVGD